METESRRLNRALAKVNQSIDVTSQSPLMDLPARKEERTVIYDDGFDK